MFARDNPPMIRIVSLNNVRSDRGFVGSRSVLSAANAAGTMLAGLIGCGIGALAFRHSNEP
jgi:hypothetical protein